MIHVGLEAILKKIQQEPKNEVLVKRFLVLLSELNDQSGKLDLSLRLAEALLWVDPSRSISLGFDVFKKSQQVEKNRRLPLRVRSLTVLITALKQKGAVAKAEILKIELDRLKAKSSKGEEATRVNKLLLGMNLEEPGADEKVAQVKIPEIGLFGDKPPAGIQSKPLSPEEPPKTPKKKIDSYVDLPPVDAKEFGPIILPEDVRRSLVVFTIASTWRLVKSPFLYHQRDLVLQTFLYRHSQTTLLELGSLNQSRPHHYPRPGQ